MDGLSNIREQRLKNRELIAKYFFEEFSINPIKFYEFTLFLEEKLRLELDQKTKKKIASNYLLILSTICARFGMYQEKQILDDLCFRIVNPEKYQEINKILIRYKKKFENLIEKIIHIMTKFLKEKKYTFEIKGRYKNIHSIYTKLQKKHHNNVLKLNDILAFRIILDSNSPKTCFAVLNDLHDNFYPITKYFKDYITIPKINGYQSIHTGLTNIIDNLDLPIEIQIRTKAMDEFAEKGLAAHWLYSLSKRSKLITDQERELLDHFSKISSHKKEKVYFFSYVGDLFCLEKGSTILDFAYSIHTDLGNKSKTALVNGEAKPLNYKINEGDKIQILKSEQSEIKPHWTQYVQTTSAIRKIGIHLKKTDPKGTYV